jgi:methylaspartate ammonia-lyase
LVALQKSVVMVSVRVIINMIIERINCRILRVEACEIVGGKQGVHKVTAQLPLFVDSINQRTRNINIIISFRRMNTLPLHIAYCILHIAYCILHIHQEEVSMTNEQVTE